jgi:glycosyltransferase involved in cell wall biosynthesis
VPWVNQDGVTGLVVTPTSVSALRAALARLLADPALRIKMGEDGRRRVTGEFTVHRMVQRTVALYESVVAGRASSAGGTPPCA